MARPRSWLVTGAASGIGRELAGQLARRGERLVLWDRDAAGLAAVVEALGPAVLQQQVVDVTSAEATQAAAQQAPRELTRVVHCAGILRVGPALDMAASDLRAMLDVNVLGSMHVAQALVPRLAQGATRKAPAQFAFVASVAGLRGIPGLAGYSASKFAVVGFAQALRSELAGQFVDVRVVCPPAVDTAMVQSLGTLPAAYKLSPPRPVEEVVVALLRALEREGFVTLLDLPSKLLWRLERTLPASVDRVLAWATRK